MRTVARKGFLWEQIHGCTRCHLVVGVYVKTRRSGVYQRWCYQCLNEDKVKVYMDQLSTEEVRYHEGIPKSVDILYRPLSYARVTQAANKTEYPLVINEMEAVVPDKTILNSFAYKSSGGATVYEVLHYEDNTYSCNCPGWIYRKDRERDGCKHTRMAQKGEGAAAGTLTPTPINQAQRIADSRQPTNERRYRI